jgi:putative hydrolase
MKLRADLHTHTVASGHAFSTIREIAFEASKRELELIAITDHGPNMPGGAYCWYFGNLYIVPEEMYGVDILKGIEANIIDFNGNLDLSDKFMQRLDLVIAGFHQGVSPVGSIEQNTKALIKTMKNPYVDIIAHPGNPNFPIDFEKVVKAAKEMNVFLEINNNSFRTTTRIGSLENCIEIARIIKKYKGRVSVASDAHIDIEVGCFDMAEKIIEDVGIPEEDVLNTSIMAIKEFISRKKNENLLMKHRVFP